MGRTPSYDRSRALDALLGAFLRHGYTDASLEALTAATGLSRSSLYNAFGSKRRMLDAALQHYVAKVLDPLIEPLESPDASPADISVFFTTLKAGLHGRNFGRGCLIVNCMVELGGRDRHLSKLAAAHVARLQRAFGNALDGGRGTRNATENEVLAVQYANAALAAWLVVRIDTTRAASICSTARQSSRR